MPNGADTIRITLENATPQSLHHLAEPAGGGWAAGGKNGGSGWA